MIHDVSRGRNASAGAGTPNGGKLIESDVSPKFAHQMPFRGIRGPSDWLCLSSQTQLLLLPQHLNWIHWYLSQSCYDIHLGHRCTVHEAHALPSRNGCGLFCSKSPVSFSICLHSARSPCPLHTDGNAESFFASIRVFHPLHWSFVWVCAFGARMAGRIWNVECRVLQINFCHFAWKTIFISWCSRCERNKFTSNAASGSNVTVAASQR